MRGMKVTVDAAMRARDVSRPRADHEEAARASEPGPGRPREDPAASALPADTVAPAPGSPADGGADGPAFGTPKGRRPHRRRRRR
jgi:hypothetical protein